MALATERVCGQVVAVYSNFRILFGLPQLSGSFLCCIMTTQSLTFDVWKARLREDCQRKDKLVAFNNLGEECLRVLYESGTEPSVQGIIEGGRRIA